MIVGVAGLIGSGKSTVAGMIAEEGAKLIDCDQIGREVVESDPAIQYRLVLEFGGSILNPDKTINRARLGRLAFASKKNTDILNAIVHPPLLAELNRRMADIRREKSHAVIDAALLIYWDYQTRVDYTVLVTAYTKHRIKRLRAAGMTIDEIYRRTKSQLPLSYMRERSDFVLANNTDRERLQKKARQLFRRLIAGERG